MTGIDFYVLPTDSPERRLEFACKLSEKAVAKGHRVLIAVDTDTEAETLDQCLWSFTNDSFLPHRIITPASAADPVYPVEISIQAECLDHHGLLISMSDEVPAFFSRFERYAEVVIQDKQILATSRDHWSFFQHRGYPMQHRKLRG